MNNTPNNPNRRPAQGTARPTQGTARPAGARPAQGAKPAGARPAQGATRPAGARPAQGTKPAQSAKPAGTRPPQNGGKKKKGKIGKDGILAIIMLFLVVVLAAIIIICCVKAIADTVGGNNTTDPSQTTSGTTASTLKTDPVYATPNEGDWNYGFVIKTVANTAVNTPYNSNTNTSKPYYNNLLLANNQNAYTFPNSESHLAEMYGQDGHGTSHGSVYVLNAGMVFNDGTQVQLKVDKSIIKQLTTMLKDMKAACSSLSNFSERRLLISAGYRTVEYQQERYDDEGHLGTIALPGHSEHHTGLAIDIKIQQKNSSGYATEDFNVEEQDWINANCAKYGFILRYSADKEELTGIKEESWHFRYVGVAHATYMANNNICLEEYINLLREEYHYGKAPLKVETDSEEYTIYYIPASVEKTETNVYVPATGHYEISGNNVDGFIVTIIKEK